MSHLPLQDVRHVWTAMGGTYSWGEAHRAAHAAEEAGTLDAASAADIVAVARAMDRAGARFPASFEDFFATLDREAEQLLHE